MPFVGVKKLFTRLEGGRRRLEIETSGLSHVKRLITVFILNIIFESVRDAENSAQLSTHTWLKTSLASCLTSQRFLFPSALEMVKFLRVKSFFVSKLTRAKQVMLHGIYLTSPLDCLGTPDQP